MESLVHKEVPGEYTNGVNSFQVWRTAWNSIGIRHTRIGFKPGSGVSPGHSNPLQYSCLENALDRGAGEHTHRVAKNWARLE